MEFNWQEPRVDSGPRQSQLLIESGCAWSRSTEWRLTRCSRRVTSQSLRSSCDQPLLPASCPGLTAWRRAKVPRCSFFDANALVPAFLTFEYFHPSWLSAALSWRFQALLSFFRSAPFVSCLPTLTCSNPILTSHFPLSCTSCHYPSAYYSWSAFSSALPATPHYAWTCLTALPVVRDPSTSWLRTAHLPSWQHILGSVSWCRWSRLCRLWSTRFCARQAQTSI